MKERAARCGPPSKYVVVVARDDGSVILPWSWATSISNTQVGDGAVVARPRLELQDDADIERPWGRVRVRRRDAFERDLERDLAGGTIALGDEGYVPPGA